MVIAVSPSCWLGRIHLQGYLKKLEVHQKKDIPFGFLAV